MFLFFIYVTCIFMVALITFRNGRWFLGILGIFFPVFWLIGAEAPFSVLRKAPRHAPGVSDGYVARQRHVGTLTLIILVNSVPWAQLNKGELS